MSINTAVTKFRENRGGFTLVELLIVVAIIAILAAIAIPQFTKYRLRAYATAIDSDAKNAYTAAQAYLTDYPTETITNMAKLASGGFTPSPNITMNPAVGTMTLTGGSITLQHATLLAQYPGNAAAYNELINFDGNITQVVLP